MHAQESILRDLVACNASPKLTRAVAALCQGQDAEHLPFQKLLQVLQSLPLTDYSGEFEAACLNLLAAMRAGDNSQLIESLAEQLMNQVPGDWGMTSGTTGSSKYFPMTSLAMERSSRATGRPFAVMQLTKFPLKPYEAPTYGVSTGNNAGHTHRQAADSVEQSQQWRHRSMSLGLAGPCEELPGGVFVGSVSSVLLSKHSKSGFSLERDQAGRDMSSRPVGLMYAMAKPGVEASPRYYALWLCAAANPGLQRITFFSDLFAGNMLTAIGVLQQAWRDLVDDLHAGQFASSHARRLPQAAVECVNTYLSAVSPGLLEANARHINLAMQAHQASQEAGRQQPLLGLLLPNLHAVSVVLTGSHSKFWPSLRALIPDDVPVYTPWHAGTEGLYGISRQLLELGPFDTSLSPVEQQYVMMANGSCFFEYLPVRGAAAGAGVNGSTGTGTPSVSAPAAASQHMAVMPGSTAAQEDEQQQAQQPPQQQAFTMDDLCVGQDYELVVTTFAGLTRYRVGDVVRVDGFMDFDTSTCLAAQPGAQLANILRLPVVSFKGRAGVVLNLVWEKYDEGQLLQAVNNTVQALTQQQDPSAAGHLQDNLPAAFPGLADFTVFEDHAGDTQQHYSFLWELAASSPLRQPPADAAAAADVPAGPGTAASAAAAAAVHSVCSVSREVVSCWEAVLNDNLGKHNTVYAGLLAVGQVGPATIQLVQPGSFKALKERAVADKGISPSQFKMPTVLAPGGDYACFLMERVVL